VAGLGRDAVLGGCPAAQWGELRLRLAAYPCRMEDMKDMEDP